MSSNQSDQPELAGCSFSVHPMSDDFIEIITSALENVDSSKVWMQTDPVSTIVRGRTNHIFDVSQAVFVQIARTGHHTAFHATYSIGCPGDSEGHSFLAEDNQPANQPANRKYSQNVSAKFALYPMSGGNYMDTIYEQIENMKNHGIEVNPTHYETRLKGNVDSIFKGLQQVFENTNKAGSDHTVMTVSISANSPT